MPHRGASLVWHGVAFTGIMRGEYSTAAGTAKAVSGVVYGNHAPGG